MYLCHLRAYTCGLCTQLFLLLLHLWIRLGPQVVWHNLVAEYRDTLLCEFLTENKQMWWMARSETLQWLWEWKILTAKSSSRSGDRSRGIMTWLRKDGVFSFLSSLLIVFSWPDKRAKLSKTWGLSDKNTHHSIWEWKSLTKNLL